MSDLGRPGEPEQRPGATGPTHRPAVTPHGVPGPVATGATEQVDPDAAHGEGNGGGRPAWLVPVAIGVAVLVVVGVVVGVLVGRGGADDAAPAPAASTVLLPPPTPGVEPVARAATSAFATALPTTVLQYALESSQEDAERIGAGALEAYTETFTDGDASTLTVRAAQLETPQDATVLLEQLASTLPAPAPDTGAPSSTESADVDVDLPRTGEVVVGGEPVGTFTVVDAGDGTGVAVWQNGTGVFQLTAPLADVLDAYLAYGL